ncbi:MAG: type VI secretion system contractile sheath large subunit [Alphaproteobacteria bacterium]|nr:type VI secretion system contractile sheath large subunit [Alphaproteobacteria bacterium]
MPWTPLRYRLRADCPASELPNRLLVLGDFSLGGDASPLAEREPIRVEPATFDDVLAWHSVRLKLDLPGDDGPRRLKLRINRLADLDPPALLEAHPALRAPERLAAVLRHPRFRACEATWRSLRALVDHAAPETGNEIRLLSCTPGELAAALRDTPPQETRLAALLAQHLDGLPHGTPAAAILADWTFGPDDVALLEALAPIAADACAPFIAGASPAFFGLEDFAGLAEHPNLSTRRHAAWQRLRDSDAANFIGLALPRFRLRPDYRVDAAGRAASEGQGMWGNAAFAVGMRLCDAFAERRWSAALTGGALAGLPVPPTEATVTEAREWELCHEGFIPLVHRAGHPPGFDSANTCRRAPCVGLQGSEEGVSRRLEGRLPWLLRATRLAHHLMRRAAAPEPLDDPGAWLGAIGAVDGAPDGDAPFTAATVRLDPAGRAHLALTPREPYQGAPCTLRVSPLLPVGS